MIYFPLSVMLDFLFSNFGKQRYRGSLFQEEFPDLSVEFIGDYIRKPVLNLLPLRHRLRSYTIDLDALNRQDQGG